jgi:hypothetical protein
LRAGLRAGLRVLEEACELVDGFDAKVLVR